MKAILRLLGDKKKYINTANGIPAVNYLAGKEKQNSLDPVPHKSRIPVSLTRKLWKQVKKSHIFPIQLGLFSLKQLLQAYSLYLAIVPSQRVFSVY